LKKTPHARNGATPKNRPPLHPQLPGNKKKIVHAAKCGTLPKQKAATQNDEPPEFEAQIQVHSEKEGKYCINRKERKKNCR
jgi:hypothetical protein